MAQAYDIVEEIGSPAAMVLDDIYHQQVNEGNIIPDIRAHIDRIGHFHAAGHPGRHELVGGELDYRAIFKAIDATGYRGYVGLEYSPTMDTAESLRQALRLLEDHSCPLGRGTPLAERGSRTCWLPLLCRTDCLQLSPG